MKKLLFVFVMISFTSMLLAQEAKLYNPSANAEEDILNALKEAKKQKKFVLLQAGGNWCKWCIEFARFAKADAQVDSAINANFIWYHLNWSKENKNSEIFAQYGFPQRFGFPVFIILNEKGERIHTQSSEYLEDGKTSYDKFKVLWYLDMWKPEALNPAKYKSK